MVLLNSTPFVRLPNKAAPDRRSVVYWLMHMLRRTLSLCKCLSNYYLHKRCWVPSRKTVMIGLDAEVPGGFRRLWQWEVSVFKIAAGERAPLRSRMPAAAIRRAKSGKASVIIHEQRARDAGAKRLVVVPISAAGPADFNLSPLDTMSTRLCLCLASFPNWLSLPYQLAFVVYSAILPNA